MICRPDMAMGMGMRAGEMNYWARHFAADHWDWQIYKSFILQAGVLSLWVGCLFFLCFMMTPSGRYQIYLVNGPNGYNSAQMILGMFLITWTVGTFAYGAIFTGASGYWIQTWFGAQAHCEYGHLFAKLFSLLGLIDLLGDL